MPPPTSIPPARLFSKQEFSIVGRDVSAPKEISNSGTTELTALIMFLVDATTIFRSSKVRVIVPVKAELPRK